MTEANKNTNQSNPDILSEDALRLNQQISVPVTEDTRLIPIDRTSVGPFYGSIEPYHEEVTEPTNLKPTIIQEQRIINTPEDMDKYSDLAHQNGDNIVMPNYQLSEDLANKIKDIHNKHTVEYLNGNPAAQLSVYFHELAHYNREHKQIQNIPNGNAETNLALNYTDEKSAYVAQNIALVNIYNHCKERNIEYFVYKDTKIKTDELLDMYPNLRECVEKNGTDLTSKKSLTAIAKTASEVWDKDALPAYANSEFLEYIYESNRSIVEQIQAVKDGQKAMSEQLKDIDIGYGMKIDLPDECKSFIYPDKQFIQNFILENEDGGHPSNDGLLAIDAYLEKQGLKTNEEKDEYIRNQYSKIVNREPDADTTLKDLLLNAELNPNNDRRIYYTDGLLQKNINGVAMVSENNGNDNYPIQNIESKDLVQEIKTQQGKYPPDAPTPELEAIRALNNTKMTVAANKATKVHEQQQTKEIKQPARQTTLTTENIIALQAKQNSH